MCSQSSPTDRREEAFLPISPSCTAAKRTLGALLVPLFGQFRKGRSGKYAYRRVQPYAPRAPQSAFSPVPAHQGAHHILCRE